MNVFLRSILILLVLLGTGKSIAQNQEGERKKIRVTAPYFDKNEAEFPGATILTRNRQKQIYIEHDGIEMWCDKAYHYAKEDSISAYGQIRIKQGDSLTLTSKAANYSGKTQLASCKGDVILREPKSTLTTDILYFDKKTQQAYYNTGGTVNYEGTVINSAIGRYFTKSKKYQFVNDVDIKNKEYTLKSKQLDFYSNSGFAYIYGKSKITHENTIIHCERGFYNTNTSVGYFEKNTKILYESRIFEGDSMYFDKGRSFASATNNIKVTDSANNSIITGHYAEVFRKKDSVFITKRALAKSLQEKDTLYMHADTLMVTGKPDDRIIRGFRKAKFFNKELSGKCDSIHVNRRTGITRMLREPIIWSNETQLTGDTIQLINNPKTNKIDSLLVYDNTFMIQKDSIDGFNQVKGKELVGFFDENNDLKKVDINKNTEHIQYIRKDDNELIGINKIASSSIIIVFDKNEMNEITYVGKPKGALSPDSKYPKNARKLRNFNWRAEERIFTVDDLFKDDPPLILPVIKGLEERVFEEESKSIEKEVLKTEKEESKVKKKPLKVKNNLKAKRLRNIKPVNRLGRKQTKKK